jgi:hypothetical protein
VRTTEQIRPTPRTDQTTLDRAVVATKHGLLRQVHSDLLRDGGVSKQHELGKIASVLSRPELAAAHLLDQLVGLATLVRPAVNGATARVELEGDLGLLKGKGAALEPASTKLLRETLQDLDVVRNGGSVMLDGDGDIAQSAALEDSLRVLVRELRGRPISRQSPVIRGR